MENLLYCCEHYTAKIWDLAGKALTLALSQHSGEYIPAVVLTPLEIVFNKPHPSVLLHIPDATTGKVLILLLIHKHPPRCVDLIHKKKKKSQKKIQ